MSISETPSFGFHPLGGTLEGPRAQRTASCANCSLSRRETTGAKTMDRLLCLRARIPSPPAWRPERHLGAALGSSLSRVAAPVLALPQGLSRGPWRVGWDTVRLGLAAFLWLTSPPFSAEPGVRARCDPSLPVPPPVERRAVARAARVTLAGDGPGVPSRRFSSRAPRGT